MVFECNEVEWGTAQVTLDDTPLGECKRVCEGDPACEWAVRIPDTNQCRLLGQVYEADEVWCRKERK